MAANQELAETFQVLKARNLEYKTALFMEEEKLAIECEKLSLENTYYEFLTENKVETPEEKHINLSEHPLAHKLFPLLWKDYPVELDRDSMFDVAARNSNTEFMSYLLDNKNFIGTKEIDDYPNNERVYKQMQISLIKRNAVVFKFLLDTCKKFIEMKVLDIKRVPYTSMSIYRLILDASYYSKNDNKNLSDVYKSLKLYDKHTGTQPDDLLKIEKIIDEFCYEMSSTACRERKTDPKFFLECKDMYLTCLTKFDYTQRITKFLEDVSLVYAFDIDGSIYDTYEKLMREVLSFHQDIPMTERLFEAYYSTQKTKISNIDRLTEIRRLSYYPYLRIHSDISYDFVEKILIKCRNNAYRNTNFPNWLLNAREVGRENLYNLILAYM
jgi:hypothetical protein